MKANAIKIIVAALVAATLTGCMWICRVPVPEHQYYSDDGVCTNCTWQTLHVARKFGYYPCSVGIRWMMLSTTWREIPPDLKGRDLNDAKWLRISAPFAFTVSLIGLPLDLVVDTAFLYYDYRDRQTE